MKRFFSGKVIGALAIGILGSALWENLFKPSSSWLLNLFVNITTLGIKGFQNDIYRDIAKGLHEEPSLRVMVLLYTFLLSLILITIFLHFVVKKYRNKEEVKNSKLFSILNTIFQNNFFIIPYFIVVFVFFALDVSRAIYINEAVAYYEQIRTITLPYLTDTESKSIDSDFAQVASSDDYERVTGELELIGHEYKQNLPTKPSIISSINYPTF